MTAGGGTPETGDKTKAGAVGPSMLSRGRRHLLLVVGFVLTAVGAAGLFLPLLPGTILLILAAWCFANSSARFHTWLFTHPWLGRPVREWEAHRAIRPRAKALAVTMMTLSWIYVTYFVAEGWVLPAIVGAILLASAAYVLARPNGPSRPA